MRLSDKMTQTRHDLDDIYESLGDGITTALNEMFEHGRELEKTRIIKLWEQEMACNCEDSLGHLIELIKGETNDN